MFDFHQKRKLRAVLNSPFTQGFLILLGVAVGWSAYVRYDIASEMSDRRAEAEQQAAALQARKEALEAEVEYLSSERGIEAEMRRQFDIALPGEEVVVIVEKEAEQEIVPLATSSEPDRKWYEFWR